MRILAVLYCYPPLLVPAAMCYLKLVASLVENDAEVEIVTIDPETFDSPGPIPLDETLLKVMPDGVKNHVVASPESSFLIQAIKRLDPKRRFSYFWLEPKKREWLRRGLRRVLAQDLSRYDLVLTCSQPHANHLMGLELKRRTGLPWVAYFSDPWTDSPYQTFGTETVRRHHLRLEDQILAAADRVLYTCDEMLDLVLDNHRVLDRAKTGVLPHSFVPDWYGGDHPQRLAGPPVRLLQTGSFYGPRTPLPLIDALRRVSRQRELEGKLRIDSYGGMDDRWKKLVADKDLENVFSVHGFVAYLESLRLMKQTDGLLLIDAALTSTAQSVFLPSKLIDYLGSGAPVIAVTPEHGATARVVRECGGTVVPIEKPEELDRLLLRIVDEGEIPFEPHEEACRAYDYRTVGRELLDRLQPLIR
jgi:hypothetical protein